MENTAPWNHETGHVAAVFRGVQTLRLRDLKPAVLRLPGIEGRARQPAATAKLRHHRSRLRLLQDPDDLLFAELLPLHLKALPSRSDSTPPWMNSRGGAGHMLLRAMCLGSSGFPVRSRQAGGQNAVRANGRKAGCWPGGLRWSGRRWSEWLRSPAACGRASPIR